MLNGFQETANCAKFQNNLFGNPNGGNEEKFQVNFIK